MVSKQVHITHVLPVENYSSAIARAVEWLGDRYLLAKPITIVQRRDMPGWRVRRGGLGTRTDRSIATIARN